ncbi:hypothetical protein PPROV_001014900 [Pycnococcus provasolii]|uniref:Uncharacterized protein n=1 Tax=Pycnococcus provasolii TaxID=41880 RepID=A0A830I122_9CHLO|nr:hypothetical protein PPROV_001014900 [Pycnococcus provasolii]
MADTAAAPPPQPIKKNLVAYEATVPLPVQDAQPTKDAVKKSPRTPLRSPRLVPTARFLAKNNDGSLSNSTSNNKGARKAANILKLPPAIKHIKASVTSANNPRKTRQQPRSVAKLVKIPSNHGYLNHPNHVNLLAEGGGHGDDEDEDEVEQTDLQLDAMRAVFDMHTQLDTYHTIVADKKAQLSQLENELHDAVSLTVEDFSTEDVWPPIHVDSDAIERETVRARSNLLDAGDMQQTLQLMLKRETQINIDVRRREMSIREGLAQAQEDRSKLQLQLAEAFASQHNAEHDVDMFKRKSAFSKRFNAKALSEARKEAHRLEQKNKADEAARIERKKLRMERQRKLMDKKSELATKDASFIVADEFNHTEMGKSMSAWAYEQLRTRKIDSPEELYRRFMETKDVASGKEGGLAVESDLREKQLRGVEEEEAALMAELRELRSTGGFNFSKGRAEFMHLTERLDERADVVRRVRDRESTIAHRAQAIVDGVSSVIGRVQTVCPSVNATDDDKPADETTDQPPSEEAPAADVVSATPRTLPYLDNAYLSLEALVQAVDALEALVGLSTIKEVPDKLLGKNSPESERASDSSSSSPTMDARPPSTTRPSQMSLKKRLFTQKSIKAGIDRVQNIPTNNRVLKVRDNGVLATDVEYWDRILQQDTDFNPAKEDDEAPGEDDAGEESVTVTRKMAHL